MKATSSALLFALLSSVHLTARSQPAARDANAGSAESKARPVIVLMLDPAQQGSRVLADAVGSHLAGLPIQLIREEVPRTQLSTWLETGRRRAHALGALGLFAIDVRSDQSSRLFLLEPSGEPTLIRRLPARRQAERVPIEEAGITVALLVEALLDGRHIGMVEPVPRDDAPVPPEPSTASTAPVAAQTSIQRSASPARKPLQTMQPTLALGLAGTTWLVDERWQLGVSGAVGMQLDSHWALVLDYTWYQKLTYDLPRASISLARHPIRAQLGYRASPGLSATARLGGWLDPVSRRTITTDAQYNAAAGDTTWSWGILACAGLASPLWSAIRARVDVGIEVPTQRVEYATQAETRQTLLVTRSIRPVVEVAVELGL
ncbi:MAG: hypothetical protein ACOY0T_10105 [Myxococcota bacterium]